VKADLGIRAGDLVRHNSYKDLLGIVVEVGFGKNSIHHPDRLEVIRESR
jgi:hypothetical protein